MFLNDYPAQLAIEFIDDKLSKDIPKIRRIDTVDRTYAHFFELGIGGKQFAVLVGRKAADGYFEKRQTIVVLEDRPPAMEDVDSAPTSNLSNFSRSNSRLLPHRHHAVEVRSPAALRKLLEWYSNAPLQEQQRTLPPAIKTFPQESTVQAEATNTILYGPPGTGKTYATAERAVQLCDGSNPESREELMERYSELCAEERISFVTFHQSFGYEEFVEGLRPQLSGNQVAYSVRPGVFRMACDAARARNRVRPGLQGLKLKDRTVWKMSLGANRNDEGTKVFKYAIENECVLLGCGGEVDFAGCVDEQSITEKLMDEAPETVKLSANAGPVNVLKNEVKVGDIIIVPNGNKKFRGIAEVTGEYEFLEDAPFHQARSVKWLAVFPAGKKASDIFHKDFTMRTLYKLNSTGLNYDKLEALLLAQEDEPPVQSHVLIIDEINRANISKVFGELITLLEPDKREGMVNAISVKLPYSGDVFSVPANLHVIGTMNTADRSIALLDTALRRRFDFEELEPLPAVLKGNAVPGVDLDSLLAALNMRIEALFDRDHRIGHAFFIGVGDLAELELVFRRKVIPLLQEYFYENWSNVRRALNDYGTGDFIVRSLIQQLPADGEDSLVDEPQLAYRVNDAPFPLAAFQRIYA